MKKVVGVLISVLLLVAPISAMALTAVDLELALVVDSSGSMSTAQFNTQKQGYVDAFTNNIALVDAIQDGAIGSIAVSLIYFSGPSQQQVAVDWMEVNDMASANAFANLVQATSRPYMDGTYIGAALKKATDELNANAFEGTRSLIDISGDGIGLSTESATGRDYALANDVDAINALLVGGGTTGANFFTNYVIGPSGTGFLMEISDYSQFAQAIDQKILREVQPVIPEPGTILLLGTGLIGVLALGRKKFFKK